MHGDQSLKTLNLQQQKKQLKPCDTYKQPYNTKLKSALGNQPKITTGLIKEKMLEFKIKKPEEFSLNWKPLHKDWDAITSNYSDDNVIKDDDNDDDNTINDDDKYRYNRNGFLEDDESSDDSIFIVDPGWDDYSLQAIKSNRPIPLCPEARRARISHAGWKTKDFRGITFDQLEEKFIPVWESIQDFVAMDSRKESSRTNKKVIMQDEIINLPQWVVLVSKEDTSEKYYFFSLKAVDLEFWDSTELVNKHLASKEIEKMMEGSENVIDDSLPPRNDEPQIPGTRLEPRSDKECPEVEITNDEEVEITNVAIPVNLNEEEDEITDEVYELKRREKGKIVEKSRSTPFPTLIRSPRTYTNLVSSDTEKLQELMGRYTYLFGHLKERFLSRKSFDTLADHLQEVMVESLPTMLDTHIKKQVKKQVPEQVPQTTCRPSAIRLRDQDDPHDDAHPEGENSAKRQKTSDYEANVSGESSSGQVNEEEQGDNTVVLHWCILVYQVIEQLRARSGMDMKMAKTCYHSHYPEAPALSLINQDLLYLKKGSSGPVKIVLSLHKFPAIIFNNDDIEERTSRWVNKCVKKFNPYARYGVEHWKNPHVKIFYIKRQKEPGKPNEEVYSNSKIIQAIKTYWELGHEYKFITEIVARRANKCIMSITEPDYKNLNKNDIEDMYLLIMNGKVPDYAETGLMWSLSVFIRSSVIWERVHDFQFGIKSYQQKVNLTAPTISLPGVEKNKMFSIIYEPVHGIIYKNSLKEKRVMRHSEIHKFYDATLNRVLEGLKSYNNDVKYGYEQRELTDDDVEYLKLFEKEIEVRLKYHNQMKIWEIPNNDDDDDDEDPPAGQNQGKNTKSRRNKESESSKKPSSTKETPKGKAPSKGSKFGKSTSTKEPFEKPIAEVVMDDAGKNVVRDDDQPQDTSEPKTATTPNPEWFKQPPRPPTPDPEWNKRQVVLG
ncbi:hypothetical protein Tco_1142813 [Tanacetum coccineum]